MATIAATDLLFLQSTAIIIVTVACNRNPFFHASHSLQKLTLARDLAWESCLVPVLFLSPSPASLSQPLTPTKRIRVHRLRHPPLQVPVIG